MKGSSFRNATVFDTCSVIDLESEFKFLSAARLTSSRSHAGSGLLDAIAVAELNHCSVSSRLMLQGRFATNSFRGMICFAMK